VYSVVLSPEPSPRPYISLARYLGTQNRAGAPDLRCHHPHPHQAYTNDNCRRG